MAFTTVPVKLLNTNVTAVGPGRYQFTTGANAKIQYNPDNLGLVYSDPTATPAAGVWRDLIAVSSQGGLLTDGFGYRVLCSGSAGTTRWSKVKNAGASNVATPGNTFLPEVSNTQIPISATAAAPSGGISTITATAHGFAVGDVATFAGAATAGYNDTNFQVLSVPTANTFTIASGTLAALA